MQGALARQCCQTSTSGSEESFAQPWTWRTYLAACSTWSYTSVHTAQRGMYCKSKAQANILLCSARAEALKLAYLPLCCRCAPVRLLPLHSATCRIVVIQGQVLYEDTSVLPNYAFSHKLGKFGLTTYHISRISEAMWSSHGRLRSGTDFLPAACLGLPYFC